MIQSTSTTNPKNHSMGQKKWQLFYNKQQSGSIRQVHVNDMSYIQLVSSTRLFRGMIINSQFSFTYYSASLSAKRPNTKQLQHKKYTNTRTQTQVKNTQIYDNLITTEPNN
jgi:hypothetical protein